MSSVVLGKRPGDLIDQGAVKYAKEDDKAVLPWMRVVTNVMPILEKLFKTGLLPYRERPECIGKFMSLNIEETKSDAEYQKICESVLSKPCQYVNRSGDPISTRCTLEDFAQRVDQIVQKLFDLAKADLEKLEKGQSTFIHPLLVFEKLKVGKSFKLKDVLEYLLDYFVSRPLLAQGVRAVIKNCVDNLYKSHGNCETLPLQLLEIHSLCQRLYTLVEAGSFTLDEQQIKAIIDAAFTQIAELVHASNLQPVYFILNDETALKTPFTLLPNNDNDLSDMQGKLSSWLTNWSPIFENHPEVKQHLATLINRLEERICKREGEQAACGLEKCQIMRRRLNLPHQHTGAWTVLLLEDGEFTLSPQDCIQLKKETKFFDSIMTNPQFVGEKIPFAGFTVRDFQVFLKFMRNEFGEKLDLDEWVKLVKLADFTNLHLRDDRIFRTWCPLTSKSPASFIKVQEKLEFSLTPEGQKFWIKYRDDYISAFFSNPESRVHFNQGIQALEEEMKKIPKEKEWMHVQSLAIRTKTKYQAASLAKFAHLSQLTINCHHTPCEYIERSKELKELKGLTLEYWEPDTPFALGLDGLLIENLTVDYVKESNLPLLFASTNKLAKLKCLKIRFGAVPPQQIGFPSSPFDSHPALEQVIFATNWSFHFHHYFVWEACVNRLKKSITLHSASSKLDTSQMVQRLSSYYPFITQIIITNHFEQPITLNVPEKV